MKCKRLTISVPYELYKHLKKYKKLNKSQICKIALEEATDPRSISSSYRIAQLEDIVLVLRARIRLIQNTIANITKDLLED